MPRPEEGLDEKQESVRSSARSSKKKSSALQAALACTLSYRLSKQHQHGGKSVHHSQQHVDKTCGVASPSFASPSPHALSSPGTGCSMRKKQ